MRLKRLELQGYKSFAARSQFVFDSGVTAIVGPNGSGKSNIADAVRWVLGEQSYRLLRGKRTEDMIFSGSSQRARSGMAQVTMVLDNSEGWLPIDYSEISITRRAHRSGENEYLVNGSRVRLKDIHELLGQTGLARRSYAVIGQGMVDAALALRSEERRELFEEAAGITAHQSKRAEALAKLEATQANLLRVNDIIAEISPQLQHLEAQAEKAERQAQLSDELTSLLRTYYSYQWHQTQSDLAEAGHTVEEQVEIVARRQEELVKIQAQINALRDEQAESRESLGDWHRTSSQRHASAEELGRDLAVWQERLRQMGHQQEELSGEILPLRVTAQALQERVTESETTLARLEAERDEQRQLLADVEKEAQARQARRQMILSALTTCRDEAFQIGTDLADRRNRLAQIEERESEHTEERKTHLEQIAQCESEIGELERQVRTLRNELDTWLEASARIETEQSKALERAARLVSERPALEEELSGATQELARLKTRRDVLARLRNEMEGYYAGVRSAMQAGIPGIIGPVAGQISVEPALERALETALGSHLQDLIVERWEVAERAIAHLKRTHGGRATFLPLDTVRSGRTLRSPGGPGVIGVACDLVKYDGRLEPVMSMLLGHTLVVEDLKAARRVMDSLRGSFQIVTPAGEIVRSSGAVSGGTIRGKDDGGMLAREREWRELPRLLQAAEAGLNEVRDRLDANRRAEAGHRRTAEDLERELGGRRKQQDELSGQIDALRQKQDRASREAEWHRRLEAQIASEVRALGARREELRADQVRLAESQSAIQERLRALQAQEADLAQDEIQERLNSLRSAVAVLDSRREGQLQVIRSQRNALQQALDQIRSREIRTEELREQQRALSAKIAQTSQERESLLSQLSGLAGQIEQAETRLAELEKKLGEMYRAEDRQRQQLHDAERQHGQLALERQRLEERLSGLHREIEQELGLVQLEASDLITGQDPLPLRPIVSELPRVQELPEGLEDEIRRLRGQLRRLGSVNPDAPAEYAAAAKRHTFLEEQVADLDQASRSLRAVIAELDEIMERDFQVTFQAINAQFKEYFSLLFGGGTARLVLTEPDDISSTGVDIMARPPGKRQQGLALLSGGERALTASALIFAILKTSPTPFCFLDEVDAALDEANVGRFREALKDLSNQIQFVLITHNRGTIEVADTIYGITMGEDNTSRSISLRLEHQVMVPR